MSGYVPGIVELDQQRDRDIRNAALNELYQRAVGLMSVFQMSSKEKFMAESILSSAMCDSVTVFEELYSWNKFTHRWEKKK